MAGTEIIYQEKNPGTKALILFRGNKTRYPARTPEIAPEAPIAGIVLSETKKE